MPLRVLIVDDNEDHADSLATLVELWGHVPAVAHDGEAGLRSARAWRPDCLILDINMPRLDGYALAREVRREPELGGAKLVAVSAYSHPDHVSRAEAAGFDYRLIKPADPAELKELLAMIEAIHRLADETKELAKKNVALTDETKELLRDVKDGLKEVKKDVREIKEDVQEIKEEIRDMKEQPDQDRPGPRSEGAD